jgi:hypothetical protein
VIHVLVASALPLAIFFAVWWLRGRRVTVRGLLLLALGCALSGVWAVIPDTPRLWGDLEYYVELHHRSYCDAWWFHCTIDRRDDIDSSMLFPVLFVLATVAVLAVAWLELRKRERAQERG